MTSTLSLRACSPTGPSSLAKCGTRTPTGWPTSAALKASLSRWPSSSAKSFPVPQAQPDAASTHRLHRDTEDVLSHAFGAWGIRRLEAEVNPGNEASNRLLQSLGFTHEGLLRKRWVAKGAAYDVNVYGLLAEEWPGASRAQ